MTIKIGQLQVCLSMREVSIAGRPVRIGSRAFEILELLIHSNGALVSKDDIIKKVWPETFVEENNLQVHISALRKLLGDGRDLIKTVPGRGYRMVRQDTFASVLPASNGNVLNIGYLSTARSLRIEASEFPLDGNIRDSSETNSGPLRAHNLPAWTSLLVGRDEVCVDIADQLALTRHLSIIGAGGIGKTRLAIEVARSLLRHFNGRAYLLSFAAMADGETVLDTFAKATGVKRHMGHDALQQTVQSFADREVLFVFDNCEHVVAEAAALAEAVLRYCSGARILATSRESLRTASETLHLLAPLTLPQQHASEEGMLQCSAVTLFLMRARAIDPTFARDDASAMFIGTICRRLDGLPLAIELAAARAVALGLQEVYRNLDDRFNTLNGGHRTALPRHQTLKATFDWSHDLLTADERRVLRRLSVFEESFTLASAKAVVCDVHISEENVILAVSGLAAKSLLVTVHSGGSIRYSFLETTRAYALQKLEDNGERRNMACRYAAFVQKIKVGQQNADAPREPAARMRVGGYRAEQVQP